MGVRDSANQCYVTFQDIYFSGYFVNRKSNCHHVHWTSVSETTRKPPLVEAQTTAFKKNHRWEKIAIWRIKLLHPAMMTLTSPGDCTLHHAMWHMVLESWQWINQGAASCNVIHWQTNRQTDRQTNGNIEGHHLCVKPQWVMLQTEWKTYRYVDTQTNRRFINHLLTYLLTYKQPRSQLL